MCKRRREMHFSGDVGYVWLYLVAFSTVVTACTAVTQKQNLRSAHTVCLCVLCGSQNKQRLFPYTALTDWFLQPRRSVFTARYGLGIYI